MSNLALTTRKGRGRAKAREERKGVGKSRGSGDRREDRRQTDKEKERRGLGQRNILVRHSSKFLPERFNPREVTSHKGDTPASE